MSRCGGEMKVSLAIAWIWFFLSVLLFFTGCAPKHPGMVRDIEVLHQDARHYIDDPEELLISADKQAQLYSDFLERFYAPWNRAEPKFNADEVFWGLDLYSARDIYGENNLPLARTWIDEMEQESDVRGYPSVHIPAVSVTHASMRVLPTRRPVFYSPDRPGEGFPFDYMQNTLLPAGTPVLVTHESRDGEWALAETDFAAGWIQWQDLAMVNDKFLQNYQDKPLIGFVSDDIPLTTEDGQFVVSGRVGMTLPLSQDQKENECWQVLVPVRDYLGQAKIVAARAAENDAYKMPFSPYQPVFADILNSLLGQSYGWGGLYENRDCSALTRDVLGGFGIFLPRNSKAQARAGHYISLEGLSTARKKGLIAQQGRPWLTILYMPGHVALYIGLDAETGEPLIFHSIWGLRTWRPFREDGRWVIGRTVITTLEPGKEMFRLARPRGLLVERITGMILTPDL